MARLTTPRTLHPALAAHGRKVAAAHSTLMKRPDFKAAPPLTRMAMVQAHIRRGGK